MNILCILFCLIPGKGYKSGNIGNLSGCGYKMEIGHIRIGNTWVEKVELENVELTWGVGALGGVRRWERGGWKNVELRHELR